ncbi:glycosyltransferase family 4 protein [Pseudohaliea rubra]|nr:glycosyltransferase family 4 protein [Pseudohaliea rubra]
MQSALTATIRVGGEVKDVTVLDPKLIYPDIDQFFCVSEWQARTFIQAHSIPRERIFITGNGIFPDNFADMPLPERAPRLVYSATPFRGLEYMPEYFSALRREHPELGFDVCSGMALYGHTREEDEKAYGALYKELQASGAEVHGPLKQKKLAEIMCKARIYTYPNIFEETFCISVLEAQAAGLAVVTSKKAALAERIEHGVDGFLIEGHPSERSYRDAFLSTVDRLLTDQDLWATVSARARDTAMRQSYRQLAESWMGCFNELLKLQKKPRLPDIPRIPAVDIGEARSGKAALTIPGDKIADYLPQTFREYGFE